MNHELLAHLSIGTTPPSSDTFGSQLHASESEAVRRILSTSSQFGQLSKLVVSVSKPTSRVAAAVQSAASTWLADSYKSEIRGLERDSLKHENMRLATFELRLAGFARIFPHLLQFLQLIVPTLDKAPRLHGLAINTALYKMAHSTGVQELKELWELLLKAANVVMGRFLIQWMVYGKVVDPEAEFFVKALKNGSKESEASKNGGNRWNMEYSLVESMIPSFIPNSVAEDVLFVGKAVAAIRESKTRKDSVVDTLIQTSTTELSLIANSAEFHPLEFQIALKRIKKAVAKILWEVVVVDENLMDHLEICRNYFLLGRGEFFVSFLKDLEKLVTATTLRLSVITDQDLSHLVQKVSSSFGPLSTNDEALLQRLHFKKNDSPTSPYAQISLPTPISITYILHWPLDLILTPHHISTTYNTLFTFLLTVKQTQLHLQQQLWTTTASPKLPKSFTARETEKTVWSIRSAMMFFVDALWGYAQTDVIATEYARMQQVVVSGGEEDFEGVQAAHTAFLKACMRGLFLDEDIGVGKVVGGAVRGCLGVCERFSGVVGSGRWVLGGVEDLLVMKKEFDEQVAFLFRVLSGVHDTGVKKVDHLDALLLRLDHNLYYSMN
ncbi:Spc97/Spc98, partial [Rhizoclosmatium globosum]